MNTIFFMGDIYFKEKKKKAFRQLKIGHNVFLTEG